MLWKIFFLVLQILCNISLKLLPIFTRLGIKANLMLFGEDCIAEIPMVLKLNPKSFNQRLQLTERRECDLIIMLYEQYLNERYYSSLTFFTLYSEDNYKKKTFFRHSFNLCILRIK